MKRIITAALVGTLLISAPAHAEKKPNALDKASDIHVGQNMTEISLLMGKPIDRSLNGDMELWQFCARDGTENKFIAIFFKAGAVSRLETYRKPWMGKCENQYKTIKWGKVAEPAPADPRQGLAGQ
jgi:hypothetical protein